MRRVEERLLARRAEIIEELKAFIAIPSISTDPAYARAVQSAAEFVAARLSDAGLKNATVHRTGGHPVVTASRCHQPGKPTILIYGHYDVQPPDPLDAWLTPPFDAVVRNNRLYGRGASDDKGPMLIPIKVIEAFLLERGELPVNVRCLFEGEEEVSSANLDGFIAEHKSALAADFVLSADGAQWRADLPTVIIASRGICALALIVRGAGKDLHSGRHGGVVANPIAALAELVAGLHDRKGRVAVRGFYDDVQAVSTSERAAIAALPFDERAYLDSIGASAPAGEAGYTVLERNWIRPTLELNGITGGYTGPGKKTVIPAVASAKVTCRLVPNQDPERIKQCIAAHLKERAPRGVSVDVAFEPGGAPAYALPADHPGLVLAEEVLEEITAIKPRRVRMGATVPIGELFKRHLGIDTVFFSFATSDEDYHAPNEFFRLSSLETGLRAWTRYFERLGSMARPTAP